MEEAVENVETTQEENSAPPEGATSEENTTQSRTSQLDENSEEISTSGPSLQELEFLNDVPLTIKVELGDAELRIRDLLQLQNNSVIELEKLAGEPLDFFLNKKMVAKGEVVVVNEKYGIRLTDIIRLDDSKGQN